MKYLILLLLTACSSEQVVHRPNCVVVEKGIYLGSHFSMLRCAKLPPCSDGDISCLNETRCAEENDNGSYNCVRVNHGRVIDEE